MSSRYGRGKFEAHENYIAYMQSIVTHKNFDGMPNAVSNGKINWQVSSGKSTSFYEYYLLRWDWWVDKADSLGLPGVGKEGERFSVAARMINPTGYRACRLCGEDWNVGYFYLNQRLFNKLINLYPEANLFKRQPIDSAIHELKKHLSDQDLRALFSSIFPERQAFFDEFGVSKTAFEKSNYINSKAWLTPGFKANPPDRLDGLHDYHFDCSDNHDPGRSVANMRTYNHDRRSFEFWAEGNWAVADMLYNLAGIGYCVDCPEESEEIKISPDHIGPISCGFKQLPLFNPMCTGHNSSKNRRFTKRDVDLLLSYEAINETSVASFQIRAHWDKYKNEMKDDFDTRSLSNSLRSLQDAYFRILCEIWKQGDVRFLCTLLSPNYAFDDVVFEDLDPSRLTFKSFSISKKITPNRKSLFVRSIRVALESIAEYSSKSESGRKLMRNDFIQNEEIIKKMLTDIASVNTDDIDKIWADKIPFSVALQDEEKIIAYLTDSEEIPSNVNDGIRYQLLKNCLDEIGYNAVIRAV